MVSKVIYLTYVLNHLSYVFLLFRIKPSPHYVPYPSEIVYLYPGP